MTTTSRAIEREARYHLNAYKFVYQALRFTQQNLKRGIPEGSESEEAHISGVELLEGIRAFALEQFGLMTRTVFRFWGIRGTGDFGRIVFELIDRGEMSKTDRDQLSDFFDVYDFEDAFDRNYQVDARQVFSR
jgi:uncharacterized repeat protein (TIGR04138 family)